MIDKQDLIRRRNSICEICNGKIDWKHPADLNHCIVKKRRGHPEFDVEINYQIVHHGNCHDKAHSYEERKKFWRRQKERGYPVDEWYASLDLRVKEYFD